jgi:hypothetical protein
MMSRFNDWVADNVFAGRDGTANARPGLRADLDAPPKVSHFTHGEPIAMISADKCRRQVATILGGFLMLASLAATGCQTDVGGQTLPSGYYLSDDVQYYAPGPEFKLAREAAALKEQSAEQISERQQ